MIPILMLEPKYVVPGILVGTPKPEQEVAVIAVQLFGSNLDRASQNKIASQTVAGAPPLFARMLAKIAHGYMVAEHHSADLEYLLPNVILGTERAITRSEEHTSELQSLMRSSYAVSCLQKKQLNYDLYKKQ